MPGKGIPKKQLKKPFATRNFMGGASKFAVVMPGVEFIAHTTIKTVVAENSAFQAFGAPLPTLSIMAGRFGGLLINVLR